jgi:predicted dienelactone hydrolase
MTPQELNQLIQAIPDWQTKSPVTLFAELSEATILYEDRRDWTWKGIADVINPETGIRFGREGCKKLQDALLAAGEELWVSQICAGLPLNDPEIQAVLRYLDSVGAVPGARHVANAVYRMISALEQNNITTTPEGVAEAQAELLLELYKNSKIDEKQDQLQAYREAMNVWDGTPETEPRF